MAVPFWQPGTLYQPGDIVQPITAPAPTAAQVANGDFSAGNVNWDFTGGAQFATTGGYAGNGPCVTMPGSVPDGLALNRSKLVVPSSGSTFEASAMIQQGASIAGATRGWVEVQWFDADDNFLLYERGNVISDGSGGQWNKSTVTATRPAGAAYARAGIGLFSVADHTHPIWGDNLTVSGTFGGLPDGLVYRAVQEASGFSAASEPAWPPILGQEVIDNEVTWEAVASTRVTWETSPLYVSGPTEPNWPTDVDGFVRDGTLNWRAVSRRVEDENCPNTKVVVIGASKVFCADDDIVRYSATVNPLDWTTANDAGYLPTGLQNYGSNPVSALGLYRGNLVAFNSEAFQLWQIDEDPANMALLDALPIGSTHHFSIAPVSNDLFFASSQGVRSIGIAASSTNYQAGDVGMPVDELVREALRVSAANKTGVMGTWFPSAGQYLLGFSDYPPGDLEIKGNLGNMTSGRELAFFSYTASGGVLPYGDFSIIDGELPSGLLLNPNGRVSGTPTGSGLYSWTVRVKDSDGNFSSINDTSIVVDKLSSTPIPVLVRVLGQISGGGIPDEVLSRFRNTPWVEPITARPGDWAIIHTRSWSDGVDSVPAETRSIIYPGENESVDYFYDSGWRGNTSHQQSLDSALERNLLNQYKGEIVECAATQIAAKENMFYQSTAFEYPDDFEFNFSLRLLIYRYASYFNVTNYIQYPDPSLIPVDLKKVDGIPGFYISESGEMFRVDWDFFALQSK
ncbi:hypothetical protein FHR47_002302 [Xanthomonas arboricola]|uniref:Ig domain-containing protein n=1 Tax=Xanthomonas cannabis TaxID=1885674 RepID=UPI0016202D0E|nr:Ig domain-containing protein [Xanthomonas cannabis]MBB3802054.1 hypothetical protein [Xanthomonas cannabis]